MGNLLKINTPSFTERFKDFIEFAKGAFLEFSVVDALDIILITTFFFFTIKLLKTRKAKALVLGILIGAAVFCVAEIFGMLATEYLLSSIFQVGLVLLVIIFQPEIRDALERLGYGSIHGLMSIGESKSHKRISYRTVDAVCSAVRELSASNTGALIVLTRTTRIDDVINTGVTINADVNSYLLRNLFFNKAPLHDGAVIIDDGRIAAAGCLLPLTRRTDVDSDLGTRHRAAIGMCEESDAIIVVVSEETGIISVASDCALLRNFTPEALRKFLLHRMLNEHIDDDVN